MPRMTSITAAPKMIRANVVSSFTVVKGALIDETYAVFSAWDFARTKRENLDRLREENFIGASSTTWLRDVAKVLNRRFDPAGRDRAGLGERARTAGRVTRRDAEGQRVRPGLDQPGRDALPHSHAAGVSR